MTKQSVPAFLLLLFLAFFISQRSSYAQGLPCEVHNQMIMTSLEGTWNTQVQHLNEIGKIVLLKSDCSPINQSVPGADPQEKNQWVQAQVVDTNNPLVVGHQLGPKEDFYTSLLFSMVEVSSSGKSVLDHYVNATAAKQYALPTPSKTCLFYVAAKGPGDPVTVKFELNGAKCTVKNDIAKRTYHFMAE